MHGGRDGHVPPRHGGKEIEGSNEERIENDCFTSRVVGGFVTDRQDHGMTPKRLATVHGQTFSVENAINRSRENV
jgi:hypothetical protein